MRRHSRLLLLELLLEQGNVAEGPTTNIFVVDAQGGLRPPPVEHVLLRVTRSTILEIAKHDGLDVAEESVSPEALFAASEVFLTGTTAGVWPVASIDDQLVSDVVPGPVSSALGEHFQRIVAGEDDAFERWLTPVGS